MNSHARSSSLLVATIGLASVLALGACGGKGKGSAAGPGPAPGGTPFDQNAVKAAIAATAADATQSCGADGATTVGDVMIAQRAMLAGSGNVDESFTCRAGLTEGTWDCTWELVQRSAAEAADDPCGGGGSAYQAIVRVNADGSLTADGIACVAPG